MNDPLDNRGSSNDACFNREQVTNLWQCNIRNNDRVQGTGSVLERLALVTVGVVLIFVILSFLLFGTLNVPWHGVLCDTDICLGGGASGLAAEVPACDTEHAGCDREKDLKLREEFEVRLLGLTGGTRCA